MKTVTILIPCYNEAQSLTVLHEEIIRVISSLEDYAWEILFVNDGSHDNTMEVIHALREKDLRVSYVDLSRNFGKENAMLAGLDYAKGDAVVIMDADLQHPPAVIPELIRKWEEGYDDVYAQRKGRGRESWLRKKLTKFYYRLLQNSSRMDVLPNVGDFRLLDRKCVDALRQMRESGRYTKGMYCFIGFKKTGVEFETQDRASGKSSMSYRKLVNLALEGITSYTTVPLRWATFIGIIVSLFAFAYMVFVLVKAILFGDPVAGYPTLITVVLFLGGVQLLTIGIIGEYLAKVFLEVKNRPVYFVREYKGSEEIVAYEKDK
jgi:glycosyltransferase involved in cell wall biosynthesis